MVGLRQSLWIVLTGAAVVLLTAGGCGNQSSSGFSDTTGAGSGSSSDDSGLGGSGDNSGGGPGGGLVGPTPPAKPCTGGGLSCYVKQGCSTTLSGHVYDPAGVNPLYNVVVFVPDDPKGMGLPQITPGTKTCNTCDTSIGKYVTATTSDATGHFVLPGVPATTHVPLVVQTGKWRREVFLNSVTACTDNPVDPKNSRLPRNRQEGDMPQMLLMTGGCDDLGCFMRSIGVDASEFSAPKAGGRLDVYQGAGVGSAIGLAGLGLGAGLSSGTAGTWGSPVLAKSDYEYYDIAILSCECAEHVETAAGKQALHDWANEGGKVFASHYNYSWFKSGPTDFQGVAKWTAMSGAATGMGTYNLDTSFPKGMVLQQWLSSVKITPPVTGNTISLSSVADSVVSVNPPTVRWIFDAANGNDVKYMSFLTPIGGIPGVHPAGEANMPAYCGKVVFTDLHTSSGLTASAMNIPGDCMSGPLTPQQAALEFLFFDLSACVAPDNQKPPPVPQNVQ
jgi:hypothetical protein